MAANMKIPPMPIQFTDDFWVKIQSSIRPLALAVGLSGGIMLLLMLIWVLTR